MRTFQFATALAVSLVCTAIPVHAQAPASHDYPSRPIRMIVPFPAGGPTDLLARVVGQRMGSPRFQCNK